MFYLGLILQKILYLRHRPDRWSSPCWFWPPDCHCFRNAGDVFCVSGSAHLAVEPEPEWSAAVVADSTGRCWSSFHHRCCRRCCCWSGDCCARRWRIDWRSTAAARESRLASSDATADGLCVVPVIYYDIIWVDPVDNSFVVFSYHYVLMFVWGKAGCRLQSRIENSLSRKVG